MSLGIYLIGALIVVGAMLSSYFLGERGTGKSKNAVYESGIMATGSTRIRYFSHFYLVAMLFVVFDVESVFIYLWASSVREIGWYGFAQVVFFSSMLLIAIGYVFAMGILNIGPSRARKINR